MNWSGTIAKIAALATIGFVIPFAILVPLEYAVSEFGIQPDWKTLLYRCLPAATACALLFLLSALTSSTPRSIVTFVQSLILHGVTFMVCFAAFVPMQHSKITDPQLGRLVWIPFVAVLLVFLLLMVLGNLPIGSIRKNAKPVGETPPD